MISPICSSNYSFLALFGVPIVAEELGKGQQKGCMKGAEVEEHRKWELKSGDTEGRDV